MNTIPRTLPRFIDPRALGELRNLEVKARMLVEGVFSGLHKSPFRGYSVEFAEYRNYFQGDDLKHIDWKIFGRTDNLYIKLHEEETNLNLQVLLDCSSSMDFQSANHLKKFEYGCFLTAALTFLGLKQQDSVGLSLFGDSVLKEIPSSNKMSHLRVIARTLEEFEKTRGEKITTNTSEAINRLAKRRQKRGVIILVSDLFDHPEKILSSLLHFKIRKFDVLVLHLLDPAEIQFNFSGDVKFQDLETGTELLTDCEAVRHEYDKNFKDYINQLRGGFKENGIDYFLCETSKPIEVSLMNYLYQRKTYKVVG